MAEPTPDTVKVTIDVSDDFIVIAPSKSRPRPDDMMVNEGFVLEPGQTFAGWTFNELHLLGDGTHSLVRKDLAVAS